MLITGKTGSGKTYLSKFLTRHVKRLVVFDGKGTLGDWQLDPYDKDAVDKIKRGEDVRTRVLVPFGADPVAWWSGVLSMVYAAGNCTIYIDELYSVCPPNQRPSDELWSIYTRGRELGLGVWAATQRPVWVPLFALSEAEHYFMFRLQLEEDRRRMAAFMSPVVEEPIRDPHGFYYSLSGWDNPRYFRELQVAPDIQEVQAKTAIPISTPPEVTRRRKLFSVTGV